MENNVKTMVEKLIKEGVDMDIILKSSGLSIKEIENISPIAYGKYLGAKKKLLEIANRMLVLGYKKEKIVEVTGVFYSKIEELESNLKGKNKSKKL
ncbi:MAG: hypothetical protein NMK33_05915 (plasmid) [Candidatus Cardinium sp.]|uniref:hypothetical protein n=1 Tax=Cardinium endosymbiont of Dermatophagoides farinae TaxID=2597823 RepID=UPI0011835D33|nr:hypothetical protein [Cardinium endosymbiont of Dermatophagoides farinae]TSJ80166.1 hypothetical protein FPG78_06080 [Cardinium endosymbiont of Dermatophagoides farinae]UWW97583.1 MAG: hypothetical protein NMK33_05915 [Candidatus Cardinium sp.]